MVSLYSFPDQEIWKASYGALMICEYQGDESLTVIPISSISAVVGMIPHPQKKINGVEVADGASYFVAEKMGLDTCTLRGDEDTSNESDDI